MSINPLQSEQQFIQSLITDPHQPIQTGYGEYVAFSNDNQEISKDTFEKIYAIFCRYLPIAIVERHHDNADLIRAEYADRYALIRAEVKQLDPHLDIAFIPRTLYELIFIHKCIREDVKRGKVCDLLTPRYHQKSQTSNLTLLKEEVSRLEQELTSKEQQVKELEMLLQLDLPDQNAIKEEIGKQNQERWALLNKSVNAENILHNTEYRMENPKCWHLLYFSAPCALEDNQDEDVKTIAYRLNRSIVKQCAIQSGLLSYHTIAALAEKKIAFLRDYYQEGLVEVKKIETGTDLQTICDCVTPGPATNFRYESSRGAIRAMGIRGNRDATLFRKTLALECSAIATNHLFLFRGSKMNKDCPYDRKDPSIPYSLSYGSSLCAGAIYDGGATALHFMRNQDAYAVSIPIEKLLASPFYTPPHNAVCQVFGSKEVFHGRTGGWKGFSLDNGLLGCLQGERRVGHLQSNLERDEFIRQFEESMSSAFILKRAHRS